MSLHAFVRTWIVVATHGLDELAIYRSAIDEDEWSTITESNGVILQGVVELSGMARVVKDDEDLA